MEEFRFLGISFMSDGKKDCKIDHHLGALASVMQTLHQTVKMEPNYKAKCSVE